MVLARFLRLEIHQQKWYWVHLSGHLSESSGFFSVGFLVGDQGGGRSRIWCSWRSTRALARGEDGNWWKTWRFRGYFDEWGMNQGDYCYIIHGVGIVVIFNPCQILVISTMIVSIGILGIVCDCCWCVYFGQYCYALSTTSNWWFQTSHGTNTVRSTWPVVSNIFYFHLYLRKWSNLTNIFQMGWNHQPDMFVVILVVEWYEPTISA